MPLVVDRVGADADDVCRDCALAREGENLELDRGLLPLAHEANVRVLEHHFSRHLGIVGHEDEQDPRRLTTTPGVCMANCWTVPETGAVSWVKALRLSVLMPAVCTS